MARDGVESICGGKLCPIASPATGSRTYDAYQFSNGTCFDACVTASLTSDCAPPNDIFPVAYLGTFTPTNIRTNYLGDPGYSTNNSGSGPTVSFQFTIPAHGSVVLVVHEETPSAGCPTGYTLDLSGVPCSGTELAVGSSSIVTDACALGGGGSNNHKLDPGEQVTISVIANNIGEAGATGSPITATLTSTSPLVTILQGSTTFPDIACGFAPNNAPNFGFHLSGAAACGTAVPFTAHFMSNEGSWNSNFTIPVTPDATVTPLQEHFETWPLTGGWTIVNNGGDCDWRSSFTILRPNATGGTGDCADADSDVCGVLTTMDTSLLSPVLDLSNPGYSQATLTFKSRFLYYAWGDKGLVDILDGTTWKNLLTYDSADAGPLTETLNLTPPYLGSATVQVRFTFVSPDWDLYWQVDDVLVTAFDSALCASHTCSCPPVTPIITGDSTNTCPATTVTLTTGAGNSNYHWYQNGNPVGTDSETYVATASGTYTVYYEEGSGCGGRSDGHIVTITTCPPERVPQSVTPVRITSSNSGVDGTVTWDASNCHSTDYHILYGRGENIASLDGASPAIEGSKCHIYAALAPGTYTWTSIPDPSTYTSRFLWFLIVGDNGGTSEGSWGLTSAGLEEGRTTASGHCACSVKDLSVTCSTP